MLLTAAVGGGLGPIAGGLVADVFLHRSLDADLNRVTPGDAVYA